MSRSRNLFDLQQIDSQLDRNHHRLREIAAILSDDVEIKQAEACLKEIEDLLSNAEKELRMAETKVKDQRLKIKQTEAKLYGGKIRNPKELQDLQDESEALKRFLIVLEDRQLEGMLEVDDHKEQHATAQATLRRAVEKAEKLNHQLTEERKGIESDNQVLRIDKQSYLNIISQADLAIYDQLRKQRFGVAVSLVKDRACSACGATLTAATHQSARSPNTITKCEACDRILFAI